MDDPILQATTFTVVHEGQEFLLRKWSTLMAAAAADSRQVLGQLGPQGKAEPHRLTGQEAVEYMRRILEVAMIRPRLAGADEQTQPGEAYTLADLGYLADRLLADVMDTRRSAGPLEASSRAGTA